MSNNIFFVIIVSMIFGCNTSIGPGYNFNLFDNTPNQRLAKAVEHENIDEIKSILEDGRVDIDLQEPKFGRTVLLLAIGNGKLKATKALLEAGANVNIRDSSNDAPINEASKLLLHNKNAYEMLDLLIQYKADVNAVVIGKGFDSVHATVPLSGVAGNFKCAKLLIDHGADPNFKNNHSYPVWINLLTDFEKDNIFIVRYIIIEKKIIPPPIILYGPNGKNLTIEDFLNSNDFPADQDKIKAREEVLLYLKSIR